MLLRTKNIVISLLIAHIIAGTTLMPIAAMKRGPNQEAQQTQPMASEQSNKKRKIKETDDMIQPVQTTDTQAATSSKKHTPQKRERDDNTRSKALKLPKPLSKKLKTSETQDLEIRDINSSKRKHYEEPQSIEQESSHKKSKVKDWDELIVKQMKQLQLAPTTMDLNQEKDRVLIDNFDPSQAHPQASCTCIIISDNVVKDPWLFAKLVQFIEALEHITSLHFDCPSLTQQQYYHIITRTMHNNEKVYETIQEIRFLKNNFIQDPYLYLFASIKKLVFKIAPNTTMFSVSDCPTLEEISVNGPDVIPLIKNKGTIKVTITNMSKLRNVEIKGIYIIEPCNLSSCHAVKHIAIHNVIITRNLLGNIAASCGRCLEQLTFVNHSWTDTAKKIVFTMLFPKAKLYERHT